MFNILTEPEVGVKHEIKKGTFVFKENDVLMHNILDLDEKKLKEIHGEKYIDNQNLRNLAKDDRFVENLFYKTLKN
jgi:hypothetical protein